MKKNNFIFCLLSAILVIPVAVTSVCNISVSSLPSGAAVLLDGITTGTTPRKPHNTLAARHSKGIPCWDHGNSWCNRNRFYRSQKKPELSIDVKKMVILLLTCMVTG